MSVHDKLALVVALAYFGLIAYGEITNRAIGIRLGGAPGEIDRSIMRLRQRPTVVFRPNTLLRAASAPASTPEMLLRPAASPTSDAEKLPRVADEDIS